ncbi:hypothetical protein F5883DRAFT_544052 [Diaporthe sp. PMI_573]|nr:hypothetical protein F5883DRAFT_544052 [Diaporthaceae sp. PMI_573]
MTGTPLIRPGSPAAGPRDAASHVNFPVDVDMYDQPCLPRRLLLGLTGQPGHSIATVANPYRAGTLGLVVLLDVAMGNINSSMITNKPPTSGGGSTSSSTSSPVDPPAVIAKLLLTCRHVVDANGPPSPSTDINRLREVLGGRSSGSAREQTLPIDFIQLGEKQFDCTLESAQTLLKANARKLETLGAKDNLSRSQRSHRDRLERDSSTLAGFIAHLEKLKDPQSRYIGTAVLSPPLTGHDGGNDWALILSGIYSIDPTTQCGDNRDDFVFGPGGPGAGSIPKLNLFWVYELDRITREDLEQSFPSQMCNVAGTTSWPDSNLHFISLDTYFTQDTVRMRCRTALKTTQQDVLRYDKEDLAQHLGSKDAMTVYHVGATTGARRGKLSHVKAHRFTGPDTEDVTVEYCILGHQGKDHFSSEGDSGSAIFGILPPSPGAGTDGNKDEGKRIGVVGLLRGGEDLRATTFVSDVTYAIPIDRVMNHVGQQGRILNWRAI